MHVILFVTVTVHGTNAALQKQCVQGPGVQALFQTSSSRTLQVAFIREDVPSLVA